MNKRVLLVDLNNFARYPSIAIGYLTAVLRSGNIDVELLAPFSTGIQGVPRERRPPWWGRLDLELRYRSAVTRSSAVRALRKRYATYTSSQLARSKAKIVAEFSRYLDRGFDAVLVSTYLAYHSHCVAIGELCRKRGVPWILGGPYFAASDVAREWIDLPGLTALVIGEIEPNLCELVTRVIQHQSVDHIPGVRLPNTKGQPGPPAPPLKHLDALPFPDYSDFPWSKYPNKIVPIITGRGCGWGACTFCSDVTSTAGRTFRSRSVQNVLDEILHQSRLHGASLFVFTDMKLNSDLEMWHGLIGGIRKIVPAARWVGAVHVGTQDRNGLTLGELRQARAAGMVRITTGFESGSQRILDSMAKGVNLSTTSRFLIDAHQAGISVRVTMFTGYPGERSSDVASTTAFLQEHKHCIERVPLYRFQLISGTSIARRITQKPDRYAEISNLGLHHREGFIEHDYSESADPSYRRAMSQLFRVVHEINRKPINASARDFEGVM